jgi:hypothetical protein
MNVRQKKQEMIEAMNRARALEPSSFVPNKLLDTLIEKLNLKNDAELCRVLEVQPPIVSGSATANWRLAQPSLRMRRNRREHPRIEDRRHLDALTQAQARAARARDPGGGPTACVALTSRLATESHAISRNPTHCFHVLFGRPVFSCGRLASTFFSVAKSIWLISATPMRSNSLFLTSKPAFRHLLPRPAPRIRVPAW